MELVLFSGLLVVQTSITTGPMGSAKDTCFQSLDALRSTKWQGMGCSAAVFANHLVQGRALLHSLAGGPAQGAD